MFIFQDLMEMLTTLSLEIRSLCEVLVINPFSAGFCPSNLSINS